MAKVIKTGVIYTLSDSSGVRYVGQTVNARKRYGQHCSIAQNRGNRDVSKWLRSILSNGELPVFQIIEETADLDEREVYWINEYKNSGARLLNMTDGGFDYKFLQRKKLNKPWGNKHSPLQRRLMSIRRNISYFKKIGSYGVAERLEIRLVKINEAIKEIGTHRMNELLLIKYGK